MCVLEANTLIHWIAYTGHNLKKTYVSDVTVKGLHLNKVNWSSFYHF